jgi:hypothetical protein
MGIKYVTKHQNSALAFVLAFTLSLATLFTSPVPVSAQVQACTALPDTYGKITLPKDTEPVNITQQTEYSVWIRMRVKDAAHKVAVSVDSTDSGANCGVEVGMPSGATVNEWFWTKTKAAGGDFKATIPANTNVKVQIAGLASSPNVDIDLVLLVSDTCTPKDENNTYGANCTSPVVSPSPDPTTNPSIGDWDANIDGVPGVGVGDLSKLIENYGKTGMTRLDGDLDGNGTVNVLDLSRLIKHWGRAS